jgi:hypothetical protein
MNRKPVECIVIMNHNKITPLRVRYEVNDESVVVKVDRIMQTDKKTVMPSMNNPRSSEFTFRCESIQGDTRKPFTLTFNDQSGRWYMYI